MLKGAKFLTPNLLSDVKFCKDIYFY